MSDLRAELTEIHRRHRVLSPVLVVDTARDPEHPLHARFEWDNSVAGEKYRLHQAAELIRSVRVVYSDDGNGEVRERRAWVSTGLNNRPSAYLPTEEALADPVSRALVLRAFERAILALRRQYGHLQEFDAMLRRHGLGEADQDAA